jgi:hypothetical protein
LEAQGHQSPHGYVNLSLSLRPLKERVPTSCQLFIAVETSIFRFFLCYIALSLILLPTQVIHSFIHSPIQTSSQWLATPLHSLLWRQVVPTPLRALTLSVVDKAGRVLPRVWLDTTVLFRMNGSASAYRVPVVPL